MAKIGDKIRMLEGESPFYKSGTVAIVVEIDKDGDYDADFDQPENPPGSHLDIFKWQVDGCVWSVRPDQCEVIS